MTLETDLQAAVSKTQAASQKLHDVVNGDANSTITTESGPVKTLAKAVSDIDAALANSIATLTTMRDEAVTSATNAAASASAAAGSAAGQLFSDVIDLTVTDSPYSIPANSNGHLYRVDTTGGDVDIHLPNLANLAADFRLGVAKASGDEHIINVRRAGTDVINGLPNRTLSAQYNIDTFIGDIDNGAWYAAGGGLGAVNVTVDQFSGDDLTTAFTLSGAPGTQNNTTVFITGVYQQKSAYSLAGNQITFSEAPPTGTDNIEVIFGAQAPIGVPSNDTVDSIHLKTGSVTLEKVANGTPNKLLGYGASGTAEEVDPPQAFLSGMIMPYAGAAAPSGWLLCDGSPVSRTAYTALFTIIGTSFGAGDGSTTFNVPDMRGRVVAGVDAMGGTHAHRLTSSHAHNIGGTGGSDRETPTGSVTGSTGDTTLAENQLPTHSHQQNVLDGGEQYPWFKIGAGGGNGRGLNGNDMANSGFYISSTSVPITTQTAGLSHSHNHSLSAAFAGNTMFITQPWITMNYIIKT